MAAILSVERWQPESLDRPRKRDFELRQLQRTDRRGTGRWREPGDRREEAADDGGQVARVRQQLGRSRPALQRKARQPEGEIDLGVAEMRPVPVDEHSASVGNTDVVAAHIEMEERLALD